MKTIKILAVGNSYSNDTTRYIARITQSAGGDATIFAASLYFPGCTLAQHVKNIRLWNYYFEKSNFEEAKKQYYSDGVGDKYYWLQVADRQVGIKSLYEAIRYDDWDYITIQQSPDGCDDFSLYWTPRQPYLTQLYDYIQAEYQRPDMKGKKCPPILMHQTWAFNGDMAVNNEYPYYPVNYKNNTEMFKSVKEAYSLAVQKLKETKNVDIPTIKSGEAIQMAQDEYGYARVASTNLADNTLYADFISHLNDRGRYLTACVWIETIAKLTGSTIDISKSTFLPPVEGTSLEDCQKLQNIARKVVQGR